MAKLDDRIKSAPKDTVQRGWVNRIAPDFAWPYLQLMRADRPIGTWLLLWPGLWSIGLGGYAHGTALRDLIPFMLLFSVGAFVMRGAGCVVNDLTDMKFDGLVERTRGRPLPSGRVSVFQALLFLALLCAVGLVILLQFNQLTVYLGVGSLVLIVTYPFMKRLTYWPQAFLGLTFNWGALMGWAAVTGRLELPAFLLYGGGIFWTLGYDTIYAHQDKQDDALIGVKSTALKFGEKTTTALIIFYSAAMMLFVAAGATAHMGVAFYCISMAAFLHLTWQIRILDTENETTCLKIFRSNSHFGFILFAAILIGFTI